MNEDIIFRVKEQLSKDYNCTIEDFNNQNTLITDKKIIEGSRKYNDEDEILKIIIFNGKAIISADKCIKRSDIPTTGSLLSSPITTSIFVPSFLTTTPCNAKGNVTH